MTVRGRSLQDISAIPQSAQAFSNAEMGITVTCSSFVLRLRLLKLTGNGEAFISGNFRSTGTSEPAIKTTLSPQTKRSPQLLYWNRDDDVAKERTYERRCYASEQILRPAPHL